MAGSKKKRFYRAPVGQAMAEFGAMQVLLLGLMFGLVLMIANIGLLGTNQQKLQAVANEAAKLIAADQYWLGMKRSSFNLATSTTNARATVDAMLNSVGLASSSAFLVTDTPVTVGSAPNQKTFNIIRAEVSVAGIRLLGGINLPAIALTATGVSTNAAQSSASQVGSIYFYNPSNPADGAAYYMPLYGVVKNSQVTGANSEDPSSADPPPAPLTGSAPMGPNPNSLGFGTVNITFAGYAQHNDYQARDGTISHLADYVGNAQPYCMYDPPFHIPDQPPYPIPPLGPELPPGPPGPAGQPGADCK